METVTDPFAKFNRSKAYESALKYSYSTHPNSQHNGNMITILVATIPILIILLILIAFKLCDKVCPQGQRREFHLPRRISTFSSFSTMSRSHSVRQMSINTTMSHSGSCPSHLYSSGGSGGSSSRSNSNLSLNLNQLHPHSHQQHHNQHPPHTFHYGNIPPAVRADGTPLLSIELETIREPEVELEEEDEPMTFVAKK